jgi:hypothetical protein
MQLRIDNGRPVILAAMISLAAALPSPVSAQENFQNSPTPSIPIESPTPGAWTQGVPCENCPSICESGRSLELKIVPYLWLPQMNGDVTLRGETAPVHVSMGKVFDILTHDLNFAFIGQFEAKYGRVGLLANGLYMDVSPGAEVRRLQFNGDFSQTILDLALTYDLLGGDRRSACCRSSNLELLAGVRYNSLTGDLTLTGPRGDSVSAGGAEEWIDPIVGARAYVPLGERWAVQCRADVGGFGIGDSSQFAWNVEAVAECKWSERTSLFAGYRVLDIDYSRGVGDARFAYDMRLDGPIAGFIFKF